MNAGKGDAVAAACALRADAGALLYVPASGQMKRVKCEDVVNGTRPMKGSLIAKKVKSNPQVLQDIVPVTAGTMLLFRTDEDLPMRAGDVPIKTTDTTFSTPLVLPEGWYRIKGIEECRIVEKEVQEEKPVQLTLL